MLDSKQFEKRNIQAPTLNQVLLGLILFGSLEYDYPWQLQVLDGLHWSRIHCCELLDTAILQDV